MNISNLSLDITQVLLIIICGAIVYLCIARLETKKALAVIAAIVVIVLLVFFLGKQSKLAIDEGVIKDVVAVEEKKETIKETTHAAVPQKSNVAPAAPPAPKTTVAPAPVKADVTAANMQPSETAKTDVSATAQIAPPADTSASWNIQYIPGEEGPVAEMPISQGPISEPSIIGPTAPYAERRTYPDYDYWDYYDYPDWDYPDWDYPDWDWPDYPDWPDWPDWPERPERPERDPYYPDHDHFYNNPEYNLAVDYIPDSYRNADTGGYGGYSGGTDSLAAGTRRSETDHVLSDSDTSNNTYINDGSWATKVDEHVADVNNGTVDGF